METIDLIVEVMGCPTVCRHCWARGTPYAAMPLTDVKRVVEAVHSWRDAGGLRFGAYPMHEVAAHPQAADLLRLFTRHDWVDAPFQPLTTTGVPLAVRDDSRELLATAAETGTTVAWVAFHGFGHEHDRMVGRQGAFMETCLGVERLHAAGLAVGCNVFVTKTNAIQLTELAGTLSELGIEQECWQPAAFYPHGRSRRHERLRAEYDDLRSVAAEIARRSSWYRRQWADLERWTEGEWVRRAHAGDWPLVRDEGGQTAFLVCRPNLDVHFGRAGIHRERYGNLREEGVELVMRRALTAIGRSLDEIWLGSELTLPLAELAARHGTAGGHGLHFDEVSVRYLWLDRLRHARRP